MKALCELEDTLGKLIDLPLSTTEPKFDPEAEAATQVEAWQCLDGYYHVALRFENDELEALADYDEDEEWNAREYAAKVAYRENLALFDKTAEGPVDQ
jgi:hypothetical protein